MLQYYHEAVRWHFKVTRIAMSALLSNTFYRNKLKKTLSLSLFSVRIPTILPSEFGARTHSPAPFYATCFLRNKLVSCVKFSEFRENVTIKFSVDNNRFVIAKLKEAPKFSDKIFSIIRDKNEVTVIAKEGAKLLPISEQKYFKLVTFDVTLPFDLTDFLSHVSTLLAEKNIPTLAISAFSTDHILVKEKQLESAIEVLKKDGMTIS
jgi:hypothetical protein